VLADFATVVDALSCAATIQRGLNERNSGLSEERKARFRIGVNLDDVIVDKEEIYGDPVVSGAIKLSIARTGP
jgi:adenylate cyclase